MRSVVRPLVVFSLTSIVAACSGAQAKETEVPVASVAPAAAPTEKAAEAPQAPAPWPYTLPSGEERNAQLEKLKRDPGPIKSNWTPPGKNERYGHAEGIVNAPLDAVRAKLTDFAHYKDLAGPKFKNVKVVDKQGDATDVYFQLPIMKGFITIWYVTRFTQPKNDVVEGTYVKGNIKGMHIALGARPGPDDRSTIMVCDLLLTPTIPAPQSAVDEELRDACGDAINAVRKTTATPAM